MFQKANPKLILLIIIPIFVLFPIISFFSCGTKKEKFQIIPFYEANYIDSAFIDGTGKPFSKSDNYLVTGFDDFGLNTPQIDSFVCSKLTEVDSILMIFSHYHISFFKKTSITNNEHMKDHERDLVRYSMDFDFIYSYQWNEGGFLGRYDKEYKHVINELICQ